MRLRAPQRAVIATGRKISIIEQGISNRRSKANPHFEIQYSVFDILRFKCAFFKFGQKEAHSETRAKHTPENVKPLRPPRRSRGSPDRLERDAEVGDHISLPALSTRPWGRGCFRTCFAFLTLPDHWCYDFTPHSNKGIFCIGLQYKDPRDECPAWGRYCWVFLPHP